MRETVLRIKKTKVAIRLQLGPDNRSLAKLKIVLNKIMSGMYESLIDTERNNLDINKNN
jgi:hypothetical protein